jgi:hypothetical protein
VRGVSRTRPQGPGAVAYEGAQTQDPALSQGPPGRSERGVHGHRHRLIQRPVQHAAGQDGVSGRGQARVRRIGGLHTPTHCPGPGKAQHYGCAIPFIAVAAPSLSQRMHCRETGAGPVEVPSFYAEKELGFECSTGT